jgi:hypothetical protein
MATPGKSKRVAVLSALSRAGDSGSNFRSWYPSSQSTRCRAGDNFSPCFLRRTLQHADEFPSSRRGKWRKGASSKYHAMILTNSQNIHQDAWDLSLAGYCDFWWTVNGPGGLFLLVISWVGDITISREILRTLVKWTHFPVACSVYSEYLSLRLIVSYTQLTKAMRIRRRSSSLLDFSKVRVERKDFSE